MEAKDVTRDTIVLLCLAAGDILEIGYGIVHKISMFFYFSILSCQTLIVNYVLQDNPEPSRCLGVFGLSLYTQERELREVFGKYGPIEDVQVVYDAQVNIISTL